MIKRNRYSIVIKVLIGFLIGFAPWIIYYQFLMRVVTFNEFLQLTSECQFKEIKIYTRKTNYQVYGNKANSLIKIKSKVPMFQSQRCLK